MARLTGVLLTVLGIMMIRFSRQLAEHQISHMPRWYVGIMGPVATLIMMRAMLIIVGLWLVALGIGTLIGRFRLALGQ